MSNKYTFSGNGLSGIINNGNSCYLNSFVQCLSNTTDFTEFILLNKSEYFESLDLTKPECKLVKEWYRLLDGLWEDNCIVSPNSFKKICLQLVAKRMGIFTLEQQSDSSEFMILMIDSLHKGLARKVDIKIPTEGRKKIYKDAVENWIANHKNEYSEIVDLFYGQIVTYIKSKKKVISYSFQPICYLTLEIDNDNPTLHNCLNLYFREEILDNENKYKYKNELIEAEKTMEFWQLPKHLIIVLKRFNNMNNKINTHIDFPFILDMANFSRKKQGCTYDLYAVCNHMGIAQGGHYNAFCKNPNNLWYQYDDHEVTKINRRNVVTSSAYCLFYKKTE